MKAIVLQREEILDLISEEKEAIAAYERLCARYTIIPDQMALKISAARINMLESLSSGTLKIRKI